MLEGGALNMCKLVEVQTNYGGTIKVAHILV